MEIVSLMDAMKEYSPLPVLFRDLSPGKGPWITTVKAAPRLKADVTALSKLVGVKVEPKVVRRSQRVVTAHYGLGDASGQGYGNGLVIGDRCHMEYGHLNAEICAKHSNVKELTNLVITVEDAYAKGLLVNTEQFCVRIIVSLNRLITMGDPTRTQS